MAPRPRPRPRPVQKPSATTTTTSSSPNTLTVLSQAGPSSPGKGPNSTTIPLSSSHGAAKRTIVVEDTDEMFMRNRNRSSKTWQKIEQIVKESEITEKDLSESEDDDDDDDNTTPRRRKRTKIESSSVPAWRQREQLVRMLSQGISSDSEDDNSDEVVHISSSPSNQQNGKRKRLRSRSLSITPPPALPAHHIQNAKRIVRQTLEAALPNRPPSPTVIELDQDDSTDSSLQPELKALVQSIRDESQSGSTQNKSDGPGEELLLIVTWHPHPLAPDAKEEEWQYKVDKTDSFRDLFEAVADDAGVSQANIILTYQGNRFYSSVTPRVLKIWSDSAEFDAYEKTAYEYIQRHQKSVFSQPLPSPGPKARAGGIPHEPIDIDTDSEDDMLPSWRGSGSSLQPASPPRSQTQTQDSDSDARGKIKLILRSELTGTAEFSLTVRTTTQCKSVLKAFVKKANLGAENYPELFAEESAVKGKNSKKGRKSVGSGKDPRLSVDGDKFENDTQIGQTDLEDGDMVEVVGL